MFSEDEKREAISAFISEYKRINPSSIKEYDLKRDKKKAYSSDKIKALLGVKSWREVLKECKLERIVFCHEITEFILEVI